MVYVIQKNGGNKNSPSYLNIIVNHHYQGEDWVVTRKLPSMPPGISASSTSPPSEDTST